MFGRLHIFKFSAFGKLLFAFAFAYMRADQKYLGQNLLQENESIYKLI
jgi:hypothetical protein